MPDVPGEPEEPEEPDESDPRQWKSAHGYHLGIVTVLQDSLAGPSGRALRLAAAAGSLTGLIVTAAWCSVYLGTDAICRREKRMRVYKSERAYAHRDRRPPHHLLPAAASNMQLLQQ